MGFIVYCIMTIIKEILIMTYDKNDALNDKSNINNNQYDNVNINDKEMAK